MLFFEFLSTPKLIHRLQTPAAGILAQIWTFGISGRKNGHPDDEGDTFFRNIGSYKNHTASHPRRQHSS
jgi:hypothetical protein